MQPISPMSNASVQHTQHVDLATREAQVNTVAITVLKVFGAILFAAGLGCLIASLVVPAIGCVVAGAALFIILKCAVDETYDPNAYAPPGPNPPNTTNREPNPANSSVLIPIADVTNIPELSQPVIEMSPPPASLPLPDQTLLPLDLTPDQTNTLRQFMNYWKELSNVGTTLMPPNTGFRFKINEVLYACRCVDLGMVLQRDDCFGKEGLYVPNDLSTIILNENIPIYQCLATMADGIMDHTRRMTHAFDNNCYYANSKSLFINFLNALEEFKKTGDLDASIGGNTIREIFQGTTTPPDMNQIHDHPNQAEWKSTSPRPPLPTANLQGGLQQTFYLIDQNPDAGIGRHIIAHAMRLILPIVELILQKA